MTHLNQYTHPRTMILIVADSCLAVLAFLLGIYVRFGALQESIQKYPGMGFRCAVFVVAVMFCSFFAELYNHEALKGKKDVIIHVIICAVLSFLLLSWAYYVVPEAGIGRGVLAIALSAFAVFQCVTHILLESSATLAGLAKRVLILGTGPTAGMLGALVHTRNHQYVLAGYINCFPIEPPSVPEDWIVGNGDCVLEAMKRQKADKLVISLSERRGVLPLKQMLECKFSGIDILDAPSFYEQLTGKLLIEYTKPSWFIFSEGFKKTPVKLFYKTLFDMFCTVIGLIICAPMLPLIAIAIKLDSPGPVLFTQRRVGENGRVFKLYKFRTMVQDAEKMTGAVWAQEKDPRITRVGRILRKTRLDELPQFFNVLFRDMSLVGPRPERPEFIEELKKVIPYYTERHAIRPGITGWAQIKYPYGASMEDAVEKLRYDLYYVKHCSLVFDFLIAMETFKVVIFGRGAR